MSDVIGETIGPDMGDMTLTGLSIGNNLFIENAQRNKPEFALLVGNVPVKKETLDLSADSHADVLMLRTTDRPGTNVSEEARSIAGDPDKRIFGINTSQQDTLRLMVGSVLVETSPLKKILDNGEKNKFLMIMAHGGGDPWRLGEYYQGNISTEKFLSNLGVVVGKNIKDTYDCIILSACNTRGKPIPQEIIDRLGVPIFYLETFAGYDEIRKNKTEAKIGYPKENEQSQ